MEKIIEPEFEIEENEEGKIDKDRENVVIPQELYFSPYTYIRKHYEEMYPCMGGKVFSILSLVPVSLIIPKIPRKNKEIKQRINLLLLSNTGSAKSSLALEFEKITYNPVSSRKKTIARFFYDLKKIGDKPLSIIIEDIAVWLNDEEMIKLLEGILGEEEILERDTMRNIKDKNKKIQAVAYLSGTPENISDHKIRTGLLGRTCPLIVYHTQEEHEKILDFINDSMGKTDKLTDSEEIKAFYDVLYKIQNGENNEIDPIVGYIIPDEIKEEIKGFIKHLVKDIFLKHGITFAREAEEVYRFLCSHAFLKIFSKNKKGLIKENKLIIDQDDLNIAKSLIKREIITKAIILECIEQIDYWSIKTREQLRAWELKRRGYGRKELPKEAKFVMQSLVKN